MNSKRINLQNWLNDWEKSTYVELYSDDLERITICPVITGKDEIRNFSYEVRRGCGNIIINNHTEKKSKCILLDELPDEEIDLIVEKIPLISKGYRAKLVDYLISERNDIQFLGKELSFE